MVSSLRSLHWSCLPLLTAAFFFFPGIQVIMADLEHPERNRELSVQPFWNVEQKGILHNGILIEATCDPRDFMAGKFKARLDPSSGSNEIVIDFLSVRHSKLKEANLFNATKAAWNINCARTEEAENVVRNKILADPKRQKKQLLLRFPEDMVLSNKHYSPDSQEGGEISIGDDSKQETGWRRSK